MTCWQNGPMDCRHHHRHCQRVCTCIMCHLRYHGIDVIMYIYKTFYCQELALFTWLLLLTVTIAAAVVFTLNVVGWCVSSVWLFWLPLSFSLSLDVRMNEIQSMWWSISETSLPNIFANRKSSEFQLCMSSQCVHN